MKKADRGLQDLLRRGPSKRRQIGRNDSAFGGVPSLKRLHHGAKVFAQARGLAAGNAQRPPSLPGIVAAQFGKGGRRSENSAGASGMKTVAIVAREDGLGDLAFHFHSDVIGEQQIAPSLAFRLRRCQRGSQGCHGRMSEKPIYAVFRNGQLGIVIVVGVDRDAIEKSRKARRGFHGSADHRGIAGTDA
jgi:hypothetical protein